MEKNKYYVHVYTILIYKVVFKRAQLVFIQFNLNNFISHTIQITNKTIIIFYDWNSFYKTKRNLKSHTVCIIDTNETKFMLGV